MAEQNIPLQVRDLSVSFHTKQGIVRAVQHVGFSVERGKVLGIVGESGCGKSVTSLSLMNLLADNAKIEDGSAVFLNGRDVTHLPQRSWNKIRGKEIAMIFQDPMTSLNPTMTIGRQIEETIRQHERCSRQKARARALEMLRHVGLPSPELRMKEYPHQLSGGMKQRVMIAIALACRPSVLIADEPTTALDVTIQAQILNLIRKLREEDGTAVVLISHDMGVIASMSDVILVMYCSRVMEAGPAAEIFAHPRHPYTWGLLQSIPRLDTETEQLYSIAGAVPNQYEEITGCAFAPRCPFADARCRGALPPERREGAHFVRCWHEIPDVGEETDHGETNGAASGGVTSKKVLCG